jgi:beta-glucosidase
MAVLPSERQRPLPGGPLYSISKENGYPQIPSGALTAHDGSHGASATYYAADGKPLVTRTDICVCYTPNTFFETNVSQQDSPQGTARVAWVATLTAGQTGDYGFDVASNGRAELKIDGLSIAASKGGPAPAPVVGSMRLAKGAHSVEVAYEVGDNWRDPLFGIATTPKLKVGWLAPANVADAKIKAAVEAAKRADVAIVVVRDLEAEGMDRPNLTLPNDQDRLIQAVTKANPKTVVVLATGSAVTMPWLEQTPAVVEAWYGGTRGGPALASVLFGDVNPSGRLPLSFPKADRDLPTYDPARFPGNGYVLKFTEGLSTGYRHYKASGARRARYPFGYGLSYTQFVYSRLTLDRSAFKAGVAGVDGTPKGEPAITVKFSVTNTGKRAGAAVPQLYVEYPKAAGEPAPLLRGFDKVELEPGRSKQVAIALDQRAFSIYDPKAGAWTVVPGQYRVRVGDSSADTALIASLQVE